MKQLVIIGASGHGKVAADIARKNGFNSIIFLDDSETLKDCCGYAVAGKCCSFIDYDCDFFVAIGDNIVRERIFKKLQSSGANIVSLIHPNAVISKYVSIGDGVVVMAGVVVNHSAELGNGVILNTCCSVDHDCKVSDFSHISVGAHLAGAVNIGQRTLVGPGATVLSNMTICADCIIGGGAVVVQPIQTCGVYAGVPARSIK